MSPELVVKRITSADQTLITQINSLLDTGTEWDTEQGNKFLENSDNALFIAYWEGKVAGFLSAHRLQRFDKCKAEVLLYEIGVSKDFRQKGIGKALIVKVKDWAKEVDADEVWVLTNKSNIAATALYKSVGGIQENTDDVMYVFKI
jgi:ribosomal protein S18 acetylase RimI-like enzyme